MSRPRTFAARVARAMALTAALTAMCTAAVAGGLSWRWTLAREDERLRAAAATLLGEAGPDDAHAAHEADEERAEVAHAGLRIALWKRGRRLGGDEGLPTPGPADCATEPWHAIPWRRCTVVSGERSVVVVSALAPLERTRNIWTLASLAAVVFATGAALALSRRVSERIVGPLARLRGEVSAVQADAPDPSRLGPREGYEEVDALRTGLSELLARHSAALARSRRFAADAAHELRTPLATMRAELELAAEDTHLPADVQAAIGRVRATLLSMSSLSERLLILAAPLDRINLDREAVSMADLIREAVGALDDARRARVRVELDEEAMVRGDAALLRVLVDNALDNALKFGARVELIAEISRADEAVYLRVVDDGPGVPPSERGRVFEPFYRSPAARAGAARGHGVGLALIAHVARAHGGEARFEDLSSGAELRVRLPAWGTNH